MPRRDAFSMLRNSQSEMPSAGDQTPPSTVSEKTGFLPGVKPLDFIPAAEPRKRRERKWEKAHQAEIATYRGIPVELRQTILRLANTLGVAVDEVARAFLEYSLNQYHTGSLPLYPHPKSQRMTLFPEGGQAQISASNKWLHQAFPARKPERKRNKGKSPKNWESRVTYRLPPDLKAEVKQIADTHHVGVGELVLYFFLHALKAFESQSLRLEVHPKISGNTLF